MFRSAMPDVWVTVDQIVAEDDKVACRWTSTGTHEGDLFGIPPTGAKVAVTATVWYGSRTAGSPRAGSTATTSA